MKLKYIIFLLVLITPLYSQTVSDADSLLRLVKETSDDKLLDKYEEQLIGLLYSSEFTAAESLSKKLVAEAQKTGNTRFEAKALVHSYRFNSFDVKIKMLNRAEMLARSIDDNPLLAHVYMFKAISFRDNSMADSAMAYALAAKDIYENEGKTSDLMANLQLIADMHYYSGELEEAEKLYNQIMEETPDIKGSFNYRIIQNNLGLVKMRQGKYREALQYFENSINQLKNIKAVYSDSAGLAYIYRKMTETSILMGDFASAEKFFETGTAFAERFKQESDLTGYYISKALILNHRNNYDSSLVYLKKAEELERKYPDLKFKIDLYRAFYETYSAQGNFKEANSYLLLYSKTNKTADSLYNRAKLMHLYAQHNYNSAIKQIEGFRREKMLYLSLIAVMLASIFVVLFYFRRLRESNKRLVEKNLQLAFADVPELLLREHTILENEPTDFGLEPDKRTKDVDESTIDKIVADLDMLITGEKVYLNPDLTVSDLAEKLNTNRTYLSKAIQKRFNKNYLDFINSYRIAEAIKILASDSGRNLSIDGIAGMSGFNNRVTFSKVFKDATGMSPSAFLKNM
ncbi:MAG: AraC family transcriptional regulator [Ignavibacteria bacterium]|nr:AraC family transcriptional regulator [Ignavibacteria bacterium]